jgi:hypothetical protein
MLNRGSITTNIVALVNSKEPVSWVGMATPPVGLAYRLWERRHLLLQSQSLLPGIEKEIFSKQ